MDTLVYKIASTSLLLAILFSGYVTVSGLTSTIYKEIGFYMYITIQIGNIIGSITSSFIVYWLLGIKWTIIVGGTTYVIWLSVYNFHITSLMLCVSALVGIGGGFLITQQSVWVSSMPIGSKPSYYIGIFNSIFGIYGIIGSTFATIIFSLEIQLETLVWISTGISFSTILLLMVFMPNIQLDDSHIVSLNLYSQLIKNFSMWLFMPITLYQSISFVYSFVLMPLIMDHNFMIISLNFTIYSITFCLNSYLLAHIYRKIDPLYLLIINIFICCVLFTLNGMAYLYLDYLVEHDYYPVLVIGFFCGIGNSITNTIILTELARWFSDCKTVFGFNRAFQSIGASIFSLVALHISWYIYFSIMLSVIIFATVCYSFFIIRVKGNEELVEKLPLLSKI